MQAEKQNKFEEEEEVAEEKDEEEDIEAIIAEEFAVRYFLVYQLLHVLWNMGCKMS